RRVANIPAVRSLSTDLSAKRLALMKEIIPKLVRVTVLWNSANPDNASQLREAEVAAQAMGVQLRPIGVKDANDFDEAFALVQRERADALYVLRDSLLSGNRKRIADFATKNRLPAMFTTKQSVEAGGLVAYGTSFFDLFRRSA